MLSAGDQARVAQAVAAAEALSNGEIVTVVAGASDPYRDVALAWAVVLMLLGLAAAAALPGPLVRLIETATGGWSAATPGEFAAALTLLAVLLLGIGWLAFGRLGVRVVPGAVRLARVRARALLLFRLAAEHRTRARTGVLVYLSLAERRAEIVADRAIADKVSAETWGEAMAALVAAAHDGRVGDGMVAAVEQVGAVLARHFPRSPNDINELPDRLILL